MDFFFLRGFCFKEKGFSYSYNLKSKSFNLNTWSFLINQNNIILGSIHRNCIRYYKRILKYIIKNSKNTSNFSCLIKVNQEIIKWSTLFYHADNWMIVSRELDLYLYKLLWRLVKKQHPRRPNYWIYSKFWKNILGVWTFFIYDPLTGKICYLKFHNSCMKNLKNYSAPMALNVYDIKDKEKLFLALFCKHRIRFIGFYKFLYNKQKGLCFLCNKPIFFNNFKLINICSNLKFYKSIENSFHYLVLSHDTC